MNRRDFLRTLGKGVTAATGQSLVPKGVVGNVLKGVLGGANVAAPFDLKGLLASYMFPVDFVFKKKWHMNHNEVLDAISKTKNIYTNIFNLLVKKNPQFEPYYREDYNTMINYLEESRQVLLDPNHEYNLFTLKDSGKLDQLRNANTYLNHVYDGDFTPLLTNHSYHYLMTPQMKEVFKKEYGLEPTDDDYDSLFKEPFDPLERKKRHEDNIRREKEIERKYEYNNIAKDIKYSRMDKAGGAEDIDYAKYYEKVNTFDTLVEAMDRRGFLRTLGRGAVAAVAPKGAIAKALTAESPVESINTLIRGYLKNDIDGIVNFPKIHSTFTTLFSFIKRHNLDSLLDKKEIRRIEGCIKSSSPEGIQAAIKQIKEMDLEDGFVRNDSNTALHEYEINFGESGCDYDALAYILNPLAQKNLIDKETAKVIKDIMGCDVRDFIQTPEMKAEREKRLQQDAERAMKQYEYNKTAQGIDYSRMDKAGSAEDEGYAKYYENLKRFGSILEEMDRRGFLKMLGRGAVAAVAPKGAIAKALTNTLTKAPKVDIGKAILDYISVYDDSIKVPLPPAGKYYRMAGIVSNLLKAGTHYGVVNADDDFSDLLRHQFQYYNDKAEFLDGKKGVSEIFDGDYKGRYGDEDVNAIQQLKHKFTLDLDHLVDNFDLDTINPVIEFSYKNNLISPEQQTELENYGFYKNEYIEDVSSKEKQFDDKQKRQEGPDRRSDIDYSRMDKAGGSEDTDYAKYYEKVKTFDQLLSVVKEADDDIISGDTEGIEPGETGMPRGFGHPDRNRNYDDTIRLNVIYGVPEDVDNAYNTAAGKKLQQFVKQQLPWLDEYSPESNLFDPRLTYYDITNELQRVYEFFKYWIETEDYDKKASHHVERKEQAMYFLQQYPGALNNFSRVFKFIDFLYGDSPSNPENVSNYPLHVSLYDTTRELGGHQEGGWWYDVDRLVYSIPVTNLKQAEAAAKKLYNNLNKVNIDGKPTIILEKYKGSIDTTNRPKPRYE